MKIYDEFTSKLNGLDMNPQFRSLVHHRTYHIRPNQVGVPNGPFFIRIQPQELEHDVQADEISKRRQNRGLAIEPGKGQHFGLMYHKFAILHPPWNG